MPTMHVFDIRGGGMCTGIFEGRKRSVLVQSKFKGTLPPPLHGYVPASGWDSLKLWYNTLRLNAMNGRRTVWRRNNRTKSHPRPAESRTTHFFGETSRSRARAASKPTDSYPLISAESLSCPYNTATRDGNNNAPLSAARFECARRISMTAAG